MEFFMLLLYALLIFGVLFFVRKILNKFKTPKIGSLALFDGGVKVGKTTVAVATALSEYRRVHRRWKIWKFFDKIFCFKKKIEEPLLYSNIPLAVPYVPLTDELLLRLKRFRFGSIIFVDEASLVADSQLLKDKDINERLLLFNKLIGHETHGGCIIYNSQSIGDLHYSIKRCLSEFIYVHHMVKWIPFFLIAYVREDRYSESVINVNASDVEDTLKKVIMRKSVWKKFDSYAFSSLTDNLPVEDNIIKTKDLKVREMVSFRPRFQELNNQLKLEKEILKNDKK